jgi:hypothetical protein
MRRSIVQTMLGFIAAASAAVLLAMAIRAGWPPVIRPATRLPVAPCQVSAQGLTLSNRTALVSLLNDGTSPVTLHQLDLSWLADDGGALRAVDLDGFIAWQGEIASSPAQIKLTSPDGGPLTLGANWIATLRLTFDKASTAVRPISGIVSTDSGCPAYFSTEALPCNVESTGLVTRSNSIVLGIHNAGIGPATIRKLDLYWPVLDSNGALEKVQLGDDVIWEGSDLESPTTVDLSSSRAVPPIPGGTSADLTLTFAGEAQPQHYVVQIEFVEGCYLFYSTRGTSEACQVTASSLWTEDNTVNVTLQNLGNSSAEVRAVEVTWPGNSVGRLAALILGPQVLWRGQISSSPATVIPDPSLVFTPSLAPGASQRLSLAFTNEHVPSGPYSVDVAFTEGCHAFTSNAQDATPARVVRFTGVIRQLPEEGLLGEWQVGDNWVLVDVRTAIKPPRVQPNVGNLAKVIALSQPDGRLLALTIEVVPSDTLNKIEFRGTIQAYDPGGQFITVDGRQVVWDESTDIQGELKLGWIAQVAGELLSDGRIRAQSIVTTPPDETAAQVEFKGPIVSWSEARPSTWVIGSFTVTVDNSTVVTGSVRSGALAEVKAVTWKGLWPLAREVRVPRPGEPGTVQRVTGVLQGLPAASAAGEWSVRDETSPQVWQIEADNRTFIDQSRARAKIGGRVVADLICDATGHCRAVRIEVLRQE